MGGSWRIVDTGLRPAAQNIALDRALLEARQAEEIPSTLRFLRFTPSALLACGQSAAQEFNLDYCNAAHIAVQRRITGGGAIYTDEKQLDWQLYLHRRDMGAADMLAVSRRICHAAATAISALGVDAKYRPRNEIAVAGRKIVSAGGVFDRSALLCQGTLLMDCEAKMLPVMRIVAGKAPHELAELARTRIAGLNGLLGRRVDAALVRRYLTEAFESEFDVEFQEGDLTLTEHARYVAALAEIDTLDWVHLVSNPASDMPVIEAEWKFAGGALRASLAYDRRRHRIRQVCFGGDIAAYAGEFVADLEAALQDTPVERLEHNVSAFFGGRGTNPQLPGAADFIAVMRLAVKQPIVAASRA